MKEHFKDISYEVIDSMIVLSGTAIGREPETKIMTVMNRLANAYHLNVLRSFGFDIPVDRNMDVIELRGYEYWLSIDESELKKLPSATVFDFEAFDIYIKTIPSYRYAKLRIEDPFSDPFERIGGGWKLLVKWLENNDFKNSGIVKCDNAYCLEEIKNAGGMIVIDIYVPVTKVDAQ
ncbi:MAG: GyrI-like domain-containing protein [Clostridiales bacterium]|jgi:hypothetical protein|nr:GyrI-like domain-containing protein [Clostridiales bacterium]